jgi:uncharacterized protein DUF929
MNPRSSVSVNRAAAPPAKTSHKQRTAPAAQPRKKGRPPFWRNPFVITALTAVLVVVAVIVGIANAHNSSSGTGNGTGGKQASQTKVKDNRTLIDAVTKLDPTVVAAVGNGTLTNAFSALPAGDALTGPTGKPEILYIGADYCPFCAAQRWALVVALSRFGSFQHLYLTTSSSTDVYPDTNTFSFHSSTYTSQYLDFVGVETSDRDQKPLDTPTAAEQALLAKFDVAPYVPAASAGGIPWLDIANKYAMVSSGYTPAVLAGLTWAQIAEKLSNANDIVTKGIVGDANNITATICKATGLQPTSVCSAAPIPQLIQSVP